MPAKLSNELRAAGKRMTRTRRAILSVLEQSKYPLGASELHNQLKREKVAIDLVTVYRTLTILKELGLVTQLELRHEGQFRYEVRQGREHHHIRCKSCGRIVDLLLCQLKKLTALIERETRFIVGDHSLEFSGWCPKCQ